MTNVNEWCASVWTLIHTTTQHIVHLVHTIIQQQQPQQQYLEDQQHSVARLKLERERRQNSATEREVENVHKHLTHFFPLFRPYHHTLHCVYILTAPYFSLSKIESNPDFSASQFRPPPRRTTFELSEPVSNMADYNKYNERTPLVGASSGNEGSVNWETQGWRTSINQPQSEAPLDQEAPFNQKSMFVFAESDAILLGTTDQTIDLSHSKHVKVQPVDTSAHTKINQWLATAICGNDVSLYAVVFGSLSIMTVFDSTKITASIFYTTSVCAAYAGFWTPVSLFIVCCILYLFRKVYGEVGSALPLNGGAYNVLLNTTSKAVASFAACLTLVSYVATAVVSASSAITYLNGLHI